VITTNRLFANRDLMQVVHTSIAEKPAETEPAQDWEYAYRPNPRLDYIPGEAPLSIGRPAGTGNQLRTIQLETTHSKKSCALRSFVGHRLPVLTLTVFGGFVFTGSRDRSLKQFELVTGDCVNTFNGHTNWVTCSHASQGMQLGMPFSSMVLASGSADCTVKVWSVTTAEVLQTLWVGCQATAVQVHLGLAFTSDDGGMIKRWDINSGRVEKEFEAHNGAVWSMQCHGHFIFTGGDDGVAKQWHLTTLECLHQFKGHTAGVLAVCYLPMEMSGAFTQGCLCTTSEDCTIRLWRIKDENARKDSGGGDCIAMSLSSSTATKAAAYAPPEKAAELQTSCGRYPVLSAAVTDDGVMYTGDTEGHVYEYNLDCHAWVDIPEGHPLEGGPIVLKPTNSWQNTGGILGMATTSEGYLLTTSEDGSAHEFWVPHSSTPSSFKAALQPVQQGPVFESSGRSFMPLQQVEIMPHLQMRQARTTANHARHLPGLVSTPGYMQ